MNAARRKKIEAFGTMVDSIHNTITERYAEEQVGEANEDVLRTDVKHFREQLLEGRETLESVNSEEEEWRENASEKVQEGDKYAESEEASNNLDEVFMILDELNEAEGDTDFIAKWHEEYDNLSNFISDAAV